VITIAGDTPSKKNSRRLFVRGNRPVNLPSEHYEAWHDSAVRELVLAKYPAFETPCQLQITIYPKTRRKADLTNKAESIMDLLVDCFLLPDDNWEVVTGVLLRFGGVDRVNPRAEIKRVEITFD
jgi:hypothetical protein